MLTYNSHSPPTHPFRWVEQASLIVDCSFCLPQLKLATACMCRPQPRNSPLIASQQGEWPSMLRGVQIQLNYRLVFHKGPPSSIATTKILQPLRYTWSSIAIAMQALGHVLPAWLHGGGLYPPASVQHCIGQLRPGHEYCELGTTRGVYAGDNILQWRSHTAQSNSYSTHINKYPPLLLSSHGQ